MSRTSVLAIATIFVVVSVIVVALSVTDDSGFMMGDGVEIEITPFLSPSASTTNAPIERFLGGCPPGRAATAGMMVTDQPPQKIDPRLYDLMQEKVKGSLGEVYRVVQQKAFCLFFLDDGRVRGVINSSYTGIEGYYPDPFNALAFWMSKHGIDVETICQIEWVWSDPPCEPAVPVEETPTEVPEEWEKPEEPVEGERVFA